MMEIKKRISQRFWPGDILFMEMGPVVIGQKKGGNKSAVRQGGKFPGG